MEKKIHKYKDKIFSLCGKWKQETTTDWEKVTCKRCVQIRYGKEVPTDKERCIRTIKATGKRCTSKKIWGNYCLPCYKIMRGLRKHTKIEKKQKPEWGISKVRR